MKLSMKTKWKDAVNLGLKTTKELACQFAMKRAITTKNVYSFGIILIMHAICTIPVNHFDLQENIEELSTRKFLKVFQ